jgi:hypothetical protein
MLTPLIHTEVIFGSTGQRDIDACMSAANAYGALRMIWVQSSNERTFVHSGQRYGV